MKTDAIKLKRVYRLLSPAQVWQVKQLRKAGHTYSEIAKLAGCSQTIAYYTVNGMTGKSKVQSMQETIR